MLSFSLYTAIFMAFAVSAVVMLVLFYLMHLQVNVRATRAWAAAFACISARHFCSLMIASDYPVFAMGVDFFLLGFASFLWSGAGFFNDEPDHSSQLMLWFACLSLWIMGAHLTNVEFFWRSLPVHLAAGAIVLATAYRFWQTYQLQKNAAYVVLAIVIVLKGIHLIDFPFLREVASFAPAGFLLGTVLDLSIGLMLLVISLTRQQQQATQFSFSLQKEVDVRKKAEDVLKERQSLFEKVFQLVPDVLVIARKKDGCYVEMNRHWEELTGFSRSESLGKNAFELGLWVDFSQRDILLEAMQTAGEVRNIEATFRGKDGHHFFVLISGTCFEVGGESFVMYVVQDVTEQHRTELLRQSVELQLREREKRFSKIFDLVPEAISIATVPDGVLVDVNSNWEKLLGFDKDDSLGRRADQDLGIWRDTGLREQMMLRLENEPFVRGFEAELYKRDGSIILVEIFCTFFDSGNQRFMLAALRDVTAARENEFARQRAESSLYSSERQLRGILSAMGEGVVVWGSDGTVVLSNAAAANIYDLAPDQMQMMHDLDKFTFINEDDSVFANEDLPVWKTLQSGTSQRNVIVGIKRPDGLLKWVYISTDPIFSSDDSKQVEQVVISIVDISKLKLAQSNLREREAVLATVFQLVPDTLTITRMADGQYIDVNRNWEPLSGFSREEALGRTSTDLNLWVNIEERSQMIAHILEDGEVRNMIMSFRHKDGHVFKCRVAGSKFETCDGHYLLLSARNIDQEMAAENARIQAENLLRENEQRYATIFQLSPIPLGLIRTKNAKFVAVNDSWMEQLGYACQEVIGRTGLELNFWSQPEEREIMIKTLMHDGKVDRFKMHQRHKDGRILTCLLSSRLFVVNGEEMFIFSLLDVTRQYEVEKEIREMTAQLEARVRQRTIKLEQANNELAVALESLKHTQDELIRSEKMAALGSLVAGVAHELNTPIGNSVTVASTLQDQTRDLLKYIAEGKLRKSALDHYLQSATDGTAILMRTLGVASGLIRSFKQVAVDQSSSQRRKFDLKFVLQEVIATLSPMYKNTPFTLEMDLADDILMDSFPGPLGQIVTNFMTNALSHAFDGRNTGQMHIISKLVDEHHAQICFSDNGAGISEADQKRVFDPFFTTKLGQGGSGLGMNIAYNLVTGVLGGTLNLESQLGQGTCFTVVLPLSAPEISVQDGVK